MNKKGEFNIQGMIIGLLVVGLFVGFIGHMIGSLGSGYDISGYDSSSISSLDQSRALAQNLSAIESEVDTVSPNPNVFDFFADMFNKVTAPFRFAYRSYRILAGLTGDVTSTFNLPPIFAEFLSAVLVVLVIVGIVLIKFLMGKQK